MITTIPPQCQAQVDYRLVTMYNAVTYPRPIYCPHNAERGKPYCGTHLRGLPRLAPVNGRVIVK